MAVTYSQLVILRAAFEYEITNVLNVRGNQEAVIEYLKSRIAELKEEEKECLKTQVS